MLIILEISSIQHSLICYLKKKMVICLLIYRTKNILQIFHLIM
nr:MAG TPA_asm: hypothetical protein [Bacteriophage sp.]